MTQAYCVKISGTPRQYQSGVGSRELGGLTVRKPAKRLPIEEKVRVVLAVLGGKMSASEAARRHGVASR
jgi:hypothetical protein